MHKIIFYPVGNGDTSQIILENGKRILFDFRHIKKAENVETPEIDLMTTLKEELKECKKTAFDVVAFTHGDKDHIENSTDFFELLHAEKYKGNGRIKINELWVPAAMILETATNDEQSDEFVIWRDEARYRLKEGKGIRVFSKPDKLKDWLKANKLSLASRLNMITDAGSIVPNFNLETDGVEFFCHSPFIKHVDDSDDLRNEAALIFNVRFKTGNNIFDYLAIGDSKWDILEDIVETTKRHDKSNRLSWDIFNIPHHCSYLSLSDEKGETETVPKPLVKELLLLGKEGAYLVSSSYPIVDTSSGRKQAQPPHIQARNCYEKYLKKVDGAKLLITMEEPTEKKPEPIIFEIDSNGISRGGKLFGSGISIITAKPASRAGAE
jgi:hypothetical protein